MKDKEKFKGFMVLMGNIHKMKITKDLLEAYWEILKPYSNDDCDKAFKKILATAKFFPKPPDFLEHLQTGVPHMLAWETAFKAIAKPGPYMSVKFSDPAINLTIELMGGWPAFCTMETDQIKWKQIEFEKVYKGVCQNGRGPAHLPGIYEQENLRTQRIGCDMPVVMIGEPKRKLLEERYPEK